MRGRSRSTSLPVRACGGRNGRESRGLPPSRSRLILSPKRSMLERDRVGPDSTVVGPWACFIRLLDRMRLSGPCQERRSKSLMHNLRPGPLEPGQPSRQHTLSGVQWNRRSPARQGGEQSDAEARRHGDLHTHGDERGAGDGDGRARRGRAAGGRRVCRGLDHGRHGL